MARKKGTPAYSNKTVQGSHVLSRTADRKVKAAEKRTGKSASDILEHGVMEVADKITKRTPRFGEQGYKEVEEAEEATA